MQYCAVRTRAHNSGVVEQVKGPFNSYKEAMAWAEANYRHNAKLGCNDWQLISLSFPHYSKATS